MSAIASELEHEDLPILAMLMNGVPPAELADALNITTDWLEMRRWAILHRVAERPGRRVHAAAWPPVSLARSGPMATDRGRS